MNVREEYLHQPLMLTLCLEENSILVSKAILEVLKFPRQVQMLINEEQKMLLLQACTVEDREAVIIPPPPLSQFKISGHSLLKRIRKLTGWADNNSRIVYGQYISQHHAVVFDLLLAKPSEVFIPLDSEHMYIS